MARKLEKPKDAAPAAAAGADDLEIMAPARDLRISGRAITVREYGFREGLHLQRVCAPVVAALAAAAKEGHNGFDAIQGVLADYEDAVVGMIAEACVPQATTDEEKQARPGKVAEMTALLNGANDAEGQLLLLTWWAVNGGFFVRRAQTRMAMELGERLRAAKANSASAGETSTPASPSTESSAGSTPSTGTPAGS